MFWLFIQLALSSALFFQKLGKFVAYCLRDSHKGPQSFLWTSTRLWTVFRYTWIVPLHLLKVELEYRCILYVLFFNGA